MCFCVFFLRQCKSQMRQSTYDWQLNSLKLTETLEAPPHFPSSPVYECEMFCLDNITQVYSQLNVYPSNACVPTRLLLSKMFCHVFIVYPRKSIRTPDHQSHFCSHKLLSQSCKNTTVPAWPSLEPLHPTSVLSLRCHTFGHRVYLGGLWNARYISLDMPRSGLGDWLINKWSNYIILAEVDLLAYLAKGSECLLLHTKTEEIWKTKKMKIALFYYFSTLCIR